MLKLTSSEINAILMDGMDRFDLIQEGLPEENPDDYMEDDGRQYRICEFLDKETQNTYYFQYIFYPDIHSTFPGDFLIAPDEVEIVKVSVINPPKKPIEPKVILTPEQQEDKKLWDAYLKIETVPFISPKINKVPTSTINDILDFLKTKKYSIIDLRKKIIPVCIQYKIEEKSFWNWLQKKYRK